MKLRGLAEPTLLETLKATAPPFDAATERELIALAYGHRSKLVGAAAMKLVTKHVKDAAAIKAALKGRLSMKSGALVDEALRRLTRPDRGQIASALVAHEVNATAVAFEEDVEFMRELLPQLVDDGKRELFLTNWKRTSNSHYTIDLHVLPDAWFDALPALRAQHPFDRLVIWAAPLATLPPRFAELAPYLKHLTLSYVDFTELPDVVLACKSLESLAVSGFQLERLHPDLRELTKLKRLSISESKVIREVPEEIFDVTSLEFLDLGPSKIKALPSRLANLPNLEELDLRSTAITKLAPELRVLPMKKVNVRFSRLAASKVKELWPSAIVEG